MFFKDFIKNPQTTIALTFLTYIISGIDGVAGYYGARKVIEMQLRTYYFLIKKNLLTFQELWFWKWTSNVVWFEWQALPYPKSATENVENLHSASAKYSVKLQNDWLSFIKHCFNRHCLENDLQVLKVTIHNRILGWPTHLSKVQEYTQGNIHSQFCS